jgi:hypothetical protein
VRFHTQGWLDFLRSRAGNEVIELSNSGHWVTRDPRLTDLVRGFLERAAPLADARALQTAARL